MPGRPVAITRYDVKRELRPCYAPKNTDWVLVDVPAQQFLAVEGIGDPNTSPDDAHAVQAPHAVAYTLKFVSKGPLGRDFVVAPLEGLWWADRPEVFTARAKDSWHWRMLNSQPDWLTEDHIADAKETALAKKGLSTIADVRRETLHEGTSAQVLHVGCYDDEAPVLASLHHTYLAAHDLRMCGLHHEIYLNDPRRTEPAKLQTRQAPNRPQATRPEDDGARLTTRAPSTPPPLTVAVNRTGVRRRCHLM